MIGRGLGICAETGDDDECEMKSLSDDQQTKMKNSKECRGGIDGERTIQWREGM